jgi:hypothetical protein
MRYRIRAFIAYLIAVATMTTSADGADTDYVGIEIRQQMVVGNEVRLVVETYRIDRAPSSRRSDTRDAKGYLVMVDLASKEPLAERARIFGPLWDVPNPRSSLSFSAGVNFTKEDADAAIATPACEFDLDGTLVRFAGDNTRKMLVRDAFVPAKEVGAWKRQGDVKEIDDKSPVGSEDRLFTLNHRFLLLFQDGKANLFDIFTGERKEDEWLTKCFAHVRSIKDFRNVRHYLTDDLNHLVASPASIFNNFHKAIEHFELDGKTYKRSDFGLAYSRPTTSPVLFRRKIETEQDLFCEPPRGVYSIEGKLYLFTNDNLCLRLYTPDETKEFRTNPGEKPQWPLYPYVKTQHIPGSNELIFFDSNYLTARPITKTVVSVIKWNYKNRTVDRYDTNLVDLFEIADGQLRPRSIIGIK